MYVPATIVHSSSHTSPCPIQQLKTREFMLQINHNDNWTIAETSLIIRLTRTIKHTLDLATVDAVRCIMSIHCMLSYVLPTTYCRFVKLYGGFADKIHINVLSCLKDSCCTSFLAMSLLSRRACEITVFKRSSLLDMQIAFFIVYLHF